ALLTSASAGPNALRHSSAAVRHSSGSETSMTRAAAFPPAARIRSRVSRTSGERSMRNTLAPASAITAAVAAPMPPADPVITAVFVTSLLLSCEDFGIHRPLPLAQLPHRVMRRSVRAEHHAPYAARERGADPVLGESATDLALFEGAVQRCVSDPTLADHCRDAAPAGPLGDRDDARLDLPGHDLGEWSVVFVQPAIPRLRINPVVAVDHLVGDDGGAHLPVERAAVLAKRRSVAPHKRSQGRVREVLRTFGSNIDALLQFVEHAVAVDVELRRAELFGDLVHRQVRRLAIAG